MTQHILEWTGLYFHLVCISYCWGLLCLLLGIDTGMVSDSQSPGTTHSHVCLPPISCIFSQLLPWAKCKHVANRVFFHSWKLNYSQSNAVWSLPNEKQTVFFFSEWRSYNTMMGGRAGGKWRRPQVIKLAYFIVEGAGAGAGVCWKTLQLLIHRSSCSLSSVRF